MVCFLWCVVDELHVMDLVLTGLDLTDSDVDMSVGGCLCVLKSLAVSISLIIFQRVGF